MRNLNVTLATACAVVVSGALAAGAATLHVATTGSDTEGDGTQAKPYATIGNALAQSSDGDEIRIQEGLYREAVANMTKHCITFSGGWDKNWVKKYTAAPTIIKPPSTASDCLHFENVRSNNVCDIVLTGGKYGIYPVGEQGTYTSTKMFHFDRLIVTNNASGGICQNQWDKSGYGYVLASSLVANNAGNALETRTSKTTYYIINSTIVARSNNTASWSESSSGNLTYINSIVTGGSVGLNQRNGAGAHHVSYTCIGGNKQCVNGVFSALFLNRFVTAKSPALSADYRLTADSRLSGRGCDVSAHESGPVLLDLDGKPWNGTYDYGCYKSEFVAPAKADELYVAVDGDDSAAGTASAPLASLTEAFFRINANGTIHVGAGTFTEMAPASVDGVTIVGAGPARTVLTSGDTTFLPAILANASSVSVSQLACRNSNAGLKFVNDNFSLSPLTVANCDFSSNSKGVLLHSVPSNVANGPHIFSKCTITNNTGSGFEQERRVTFKLADLLIADNGGIGIYDPGYSSSVYGWNLTVVSNGTYGIALSAGGGNGGNSLYLYESILAGNKTAGLRASGSNPQDAKLYNALIDQDTPFAYTSSTKEPTRSEVKFEPAQLVVEGPRRYRLSESSPARNAGRYSHAASCPVSLETDLAGNKRSARHWDLGCYRYDLPGLMLLLR